jgi:hypothetical protein
VLTTVGPAHAVYFATYEIVKEAMGGNEKSAHHPLAAGTFCGADSTARLTFSSKQRSRSNDSQRCADESIRR